MVININVALHILLLTHNEFLHIRYIILTSLVVFGMC